MATVLDFCTDVLVLLGVQAAGEPILSSDASLVLAKTNDLLDLLNTQRLAVYGVVPYTAGLTTGKQTYTFGPTGDFNTSRPVKVERVTANNGSDYEVVLYDYARWMTIPQKGTQSSYPQVMWVDDEFPLRNVNVFPVPSSNVSVVFYVWSALQVLVNLTDTLAFAPGFKVMLTYNVARMVAPAFGRSLGPDDQGIARESLAWVKSVNVSSPTVPVDAAYLAAPVQFNIRTG